MGFLQLFVAFFLATQLPLTQTESASTFERDLVGQELERALPGGVRSRWARDKFGRPIQHQPSRVRCADHVCFGRFTT